MKAFFAWLFSEHNSNLQIGLFDRWHFFYLFIVFGGTLLLSVLGRKKPALKKKFLPLMAYLTVGLYAIDFFIMPLSDSYGGSISAYKLPFNICTIMAVLVPFVQFNSKFNRIKQPVAVLSIASSLMWMCYPGTALGGQPPFCYIIFQTFMYHGFLFCWGVLNLAYGEVALHFKKIWKELVGILMIFVWASFGNAVYDRGYNWFFIESSIFPFLSDAVMPIAVVVSVFGVCVVIYCAYYGLQALLRKKTAVK
ncbi:MAG: YwaF family protein [Oscillospiraceae bacterium]|nr:YwaF family protein [Oscillospiraceae bacterium]